MQLPRRPCTSTNESHRILQISLCSKAKTNEYHTLVDMRLLAIAAIAIAGARACSPEQDSSVEKKMREAIDRIDGDIFNVRIAPYERNLCAHPTELQRKPQLRQNLLALSEDTQAWSQSLSRLENDIQAFNPNSAGEAEEDPAASYVVDQVLSKMADNLQKIQYVHDIQERDLIRVRDDLSKILRQTAAAEREKEQENCAQRVDGPEHDLHLTWADCSCSYGNTKVLRCRFAELFGGREFESCMEGQKSFEWTFHPDFAQNLGYPWA